MNPGHRSTNLIPTFTGRLVNVLDLKPADVDIRDIAHALSLYCRFTGHSQFHYSVAQHSLLVSRLVPARLALHGLLHDASEAYLGDISRPLKHSPTMALYRALEYRTQQVICHRFGLALHEPPEVKAADLVALATEFRDVVNVQEADLGLPPPDMRRIPETPWRAIEQLFLDRFQELCMPEYQFGYWK